MKRALVISILVFVFACVVVVFIHKNKVEQKPRIEQQLQTDQSTIDKAIEIIDERTEAIKRTLEKPKTQSRTIFKPQPAEPTIIAPGFREIETLETEIAELKAEIGTLKAQIEELQSRLSGIEPVESESTIKYYPSRLSHLKKPTKKDRQQE